LKSIEIPLLHFIIWLQECIMIFLSFLFSGETSLFPPAFYRVPHCF
jgi:hypothetical protein